MRIAYLLGEFPSLSETFVLNQITGLLDRGHDVEIFASRPGDPSTVHPDVERYGLLGRTHYGRRRPGSATGRLLKAVTVVAAHLPRGAGPLLRALRVAARENRPLETFCLAVPLLRRDPFDVVHAHFGPNGLKAVRLRQCGALRGKVVTTFHGFDVTKAVGEGDLYGELFREGDLFLPISERWKRRLADLGCPSDRTVVHRMGIDCRKFSFRPRTLDPGDPVRVVTVGRLVEKKGIEYGVRALAELGNRLPVEYTVVGDGPLRPELEGLVRDLGVGDRVRFAGARPQQEVVEILDRSHLFLAPSVTARDGDQEGIPVVLMEAMSMGLPVVSTRHSGIPELVEDEVSGLLAPERDVAALAEKIRHLAANPALWPELGRAGRARVEREYDVEALNDRLVALFQGLCVPGPP